MSECNHTDSTLSTLQTCYIEGHGDAPELWYIRCRVCGKHTPATLTQGECWKMALLGWLSDDGAVCSTRWAKEAE